MSETRAAPVAARRWGSRRWRGARTALGIIAVVGAILQPGFAGTVSADPVSPLAVTKTANPSPVASGDQLTYTIGIRNTGGAKVDSVVMTDQVNGVGVIQQPPGLPQLTISSTQGSCQQGGANGNVVTCQVGTIAGGATVTITIRGQVTAANGTTLNNTASVTGTKSAQNFTTTASVSVLVQGGTGGGTSLPDLTLNKTGPTAVTVSSPLAYTLTVNNVGTVNTSNVKVVDTLPAGVAFTGVSTTSLFTCTGSGSPVTVTCTGGTVNAGQNATITLNATAPAAAGTITNTAVVDPDNAITESNELNNTSAAVNTTVSSQPPPSTALTIIKTDNNPNAYAWSTGAGPDPVNPGQLLTYKIQVKNSATTRADDVVVTDGTQGLDASSITASQVVANGTVGTTGGCTVAAPQVRCGVRTLNPGGTITITLTGRVVITAGTTIFNTATVTGNVKNVGVSATDSEATTVRPQYDLTITKAGAPNPVCARSWPQPADRGAGLPPDGLTAAGGTTPGLLATPACEGGLRYSFVVGNSGNAAVSGVTVRDPLPAGSILDSWSASGGFVCAVASGVVTCSGGSIGVASTETISLLVVPPASTGTISNTATVDPNNAIFEADETNNTATATTDVVTGVDLVAWKSDSNAADPPGDGAPTLTPGTATSLGDGYDPIATRGTETYTIYADNVGTQDTTGIRLVDTLPADTVFLSVVADAQHGFTCAHDGSATGGTVTCVGGFLKGTESEFYDPAGSAPAGPGDDFATIRIRVFARSTVGTMHNVVRIDPDNTIAEANELNNTATDDTTVTTGNADKGAYQQLAITKKNDSPASGRVATNGVLTYRLTVSNLGTDPVSNAVVTDALPSGTRFISAADTDTGVHRFFCAHDGSATGGVVTCTGGDFDGSINTAGVGVTARDILVTVFAPAAPGTATNNATVDPANLIAEGNEFDNDAQATTTVAACTSLADCTASNAYYELTIDKTQTTPANPVARNGIITYDLAVANLGSDSVHDVTVTDRLPAGFRFIDAADTVNDPNAFACSGPDATGTVRCTGGSLSGQANPIPGGAPTTRHITIRVFAPDTPGSYTNTAFVDPGNAIPEGNEFNNQDSQQTVVANGGNNPYIDLTIDKTQEKVLDQIDADPTTVQVAPGGPMKYVLEVKNLATGPDSGTAFNVSAVDNLPANATFFKAEDEATGTGSFTCAQVPGQPQTVLCTGGTIPAGSSRKIDVWAIAPRGLDQIATDQSAIQQLLTNSASVDPANAIPEGDETNNADTVKTVVKSESNLTVVSKDGPDTAQQNQEADYTITVKNEKTWGNGAIAYGARVIDNLPVGMIPLSVAVDQSNMRCSVFENPVNVVDCTGDMEPDQTVTITVHVFITASAGSLYNQACIDPYHLIDETNELDNCKTKTTNVGQTPPPPPPDASKLLINKSASTSVVTPGQSFTYTVTVSNVGTAAAPDPVKVVDSLPSQVTYQSAVATNGFTCTYTAPTVECDSPTGGLPNGQATVVTIQVTVNDGVAAAFTNTAEVTGDGQDVSASVPVNVGGAAVELVMASYADSPDPVTAGGVITYTIVATNAGTSTANNLDITDDFFFPSGVTFLSGTGSQGFTCSWSSPTATCTGDLPAGQSTTITLRFDTSASSVGTATSVVSVDASGQFTEADETNNIGFEATTINAAPCQSCIDLVMGTVDANPDPVVNGHATTWNFDVTNVGDLATSSDAAPNAVLVRINVDGAFNEYTGLSVSLPGFTCTVTSHAGTSDAGPEAECTKASMAAGEGAIGSVTATANTGSTPSVLFFNVAVDPANDITEFNEANNTGSRTVTVQ